MQEQQLPEVLISMFPDGSESVKAGFKPALGLCTVTYSIYECVGAACAHCLVVVLVFCGADRIRRSPSD